MIDLEKENTTLKDNSPEATLVRDHLSKNIIDYDTLASAKLLQKEALIVDYCL